MSHYQQDELARLFAHNMSLNQTLPQSTPDKQFLGHNTQPIYYSSQHYTPASYLHISPAPEQQQQAAAPRADSPLSGSPLDNNSKNMTPIHLASMLRNHDIEPTSLSHSQVKLFTNADYDQRLRLLELWRISPPQPSHWQQETSMAHEEELAALRYDERMRAQVDDAQAEPYMESGYANSAHSEPVYASCSGGLWRLQAEQYDRSKDMEDAQASWAQARSFEKLQAMNAQVEQQRGFASCPISSYDDDDMEL